MANRLRADSELWLNATRECHAGLHHRAVTGSIPQVRANPFRFVSIESIRIHGKESHYRPTSDKGGPMQRRGDSGCARSEGRSERLTQHSSFPQVSTAQYQVSTAQHQASTAQR